MLCSIQVGLSCSERALWRRALFPCSAVCSARVATPHCRRCMLMMLGGYVCREGALRSARRPTAHGRAFSALRTGLRTQERAGARCCGLSLTAQSHSALISTPLLPLPSRSLRPLSLHPLVMRRSSVPVWLELLVVALACCSLVQFNASGAQAQTTTTTDVSTTRSDAAPAATA